MFTSVPIGQMVFSDYTKCRILLLRERGKRTKEISGQNSAITLSCKRVSTSVPIGQMVFSDCTKHRILLLREHGKTYERNFGTAAEGRYSSESSRDFEVFIEVQAEVQ